MFPRPLQDPSLQAAALPRAECVGIELAFGEHRGGLQFCLEVVHRLKHFFTSPHGNGPHIAL